MAASTVALSFSCAAAFQGSFAQLTQALPSTRRSQGSLTTLAVVTDPDQLMQMEFFEKHEHDRNALEDIYKLATDSDGLSGDLVEDPPKMKRINTQRESAPIKKSSTTEEVRPESERRVQFRGLSTTPNPRSKKRKSLSKTPPIVRSQVLIKEQQQRTSTTFSSRSSTMPGFMERSSTNREKAYQDGIKLAESRSGKKYVDTPSAKKSRRQINGSHMYRTSACVPDSMVQFAKEIHEVERITPKEEVILGEKTQEAIKLQKIYDGLMERLDREPTDDEWCAASGKINMEAISQAIDEGSEAKNKLVMSNLRMVQGVVNVYIRNGLRGQYNAGDLMQEGVMVRILMEDYLTIILEYRADAFSFRFAMQALIRAAEKFDPGRGFRFSTYAMYWIRSAIKRDQIWQSRVVNVPQRLHESHKRINRVHKEIIDTTGHAPTKRELGAAVGMSEVQIDRCVAAVGQRCHSLDEQISNPLKPMSATSDGHTMYDLVASKSDDGDNDKLKHVFLREDLTSALHEHLSDEEANLLLLRYGMVESKPQNLKSGPLTIAEVSRMVGLKPDKVRRMINKSLKHLKSVIGDEWIEYEREVQS
jgi:RNA polymerase sigma factor (sigma-70 family)